MAERKKTEVDLSPVVHEVDYNIEKLAILKSNLSKNDSDEGKLLFEYPTVYVINTPGSNNKTYDVAPILVFGT